MYAQAIFQTITSMGPHYVTAVYRWIKMGVWDAPYRFILDVQLEKIGIERNLSLGRIPLDEECSSS